MSESIQVGDRVTWRSFRSNAKGETKRIGTVLYVRDGWLYATVKPDKGQGHRQHVELGRLTKVEGATMRGNLNALSRLLAVLCDDLAYAGASQAEREAAVVMGALHAAIVLERTGDLAALVEGWYDEHAPAAVMRLVERQRGNDK